MAKKKSPQKPAQEQPAKSGAAKLRASGRKAIMLAVTPEEYGQLAAAAAEERRPLAQFCAYYALRRAAEVEQPAGATA